MKIYQNDKLEIHDVGTNSKSDPSLKEVEVTDGTFDSWSIAKICCYRAEVVDGFVRMLTPYVDSRLIEHIDQVSIQAENASPTKLIKKGYIEDTQVIFENVPKGMIIVSIFAEGSDGSIPSFSFKIENGNVIVTFDKPLDYVTTVTLLIK